MQGNTKSVLVSIVFLSTFIGLFGFVGAGITEVNITPDTPAINDLIIITTCGVESSSVSILGSSYILDGLFLTLNISIYVGSLPMVTPWDESVNIGTLPEGTYNLTVHSIAQDYPQYDDTYYTSFEVIPEPATLGLLVLGSLLIHRRKY